MEKKQGIQKGFRGTGGCFSRKNRSLQSFPAAIPPLVNDCVLSSCSRVFRGGWVRATKCGIVRPHPRTRGAQKTRNLKLVYIAPKLLGAVKKPVIVR